MVLEPVEAALEQLGIRGRRLLVAVSGGIDSSVLLHCLAACSERHGLTLVAGHVDHGLRGDESRQDALAVEALAERLELPCRLLAVDPASALAGHVSRTRPTLQEAARSLRYEALSEMAREVEADHIATGHNLDDQTETVLMRLLRGCGPDALGGIPEASSDGRIVRPLLAASRAEIRRYAESVDLRWREDSSNEQRGYTRNRLRHDWIPGLAESFNPQLLHAVGNLAEAHRRDAEWIESMLQAETERSWTRVGADELVLPKQGWRELPEAFARRLAARAFRELGSGRDLTRVHLERMLEFLREGPGARGGSEIELPGDLRLARRREDFLLRCIRVKTPPAC